MNEDTWIWSKNTVFVSVCFMLADKLLLLVAAVC